MKLIHESNEVMQRALISNAKDIEANGGEAETIVTDWYREELPMDQIVAKAKELGKDVITIETHSIKISNYEVK